MYKQYVLDYCCATKNAPITEIMGGARTELGALSGCGQF